MKPLHADISRYGIPFTGPVNVRGLILEQREGLVLSLKSAGASAYGEIAPLPGLHDESLDEAQKAISAFLPKLSGLVRNTAEERRELFDGAELPPSVVTGLEMAMINLEAAENASLPSFPESFPPALEVPVNALLDGDAVAVMGRAGLRFVQGFRAFKLKVRAERMEEIVSCIRAFHEQFGGRAELRLDANQSLELEQAIAFGKALPSGSVSYIEEPLRDASLIPDFHALTGIRSALDESLWQQPGLLDQLPPASLGALILKPNRIGGIMKSLDLAARAYRMGLPAVLSSAFETGISLGMYSMMAAVSAPSPAACGLDTASFLAHDLLETPFATPTGMADPVAVWQNSRSVRNELLKPLTSWTS
ncbi:MAG: o-succinylbenzoate synthase [Chlorobiaceae bacterium]|nr:o-succinylbenzoate synthase [Chlorobiaceae bacterium]